MNESFMVLFNNDITFPTTRYQYCHNYSDKHQRVSKPEQYVVRPPVNME